MSSPIRKTPQEIEYHELSVRVHNILARIDEWRDKNQSRAVESRYTDEVATLNLGDLMHELENLCDNMMIRIDDL